MQAGIEVTNSYMFQTKQNFSKHFMISTVWSVGTCVLGYRYSVLDQFSVVPFQ